MAPWIENISAEDLPWGNHINPGPNSMLIQIMDSCCMHWPIPQHSFKETYQFEFLDVEDNDPEFSEFEITEHQAKELVRLLKHALEDNMNVVVHCHAGICRSGAVVEVGVIMGFTDTNRYRLSNTRVKRLMMKELGLTYDSTNDICEVIVRALR
jgi:protein tyrosine phosphatase